MSNYTINEKIHEFLYELYVLCSHTHQLKCGVTFLTSWLGKYEAMDQGCQHYEFFCRNTEFRKWSVFLQICTWSFKIYRFLTDFAIFWFFSTFFIRNWESSQLWSASIEVWACSCSDVYNFVFVNLNFVIRMSKKFEKKIKFHIFRDKWVKKFFTCFALQIFSFILIPILPAYRLFRRLRITFQACT